MLRDALEAKGYRFWHAPCAADAESLLDEIQVDLILCDLMLPDASGSVPAPRRTLSAGAGGTARAGAGRQLGRRSRPLPRHGRGKGDRASTSAPPAGPTSLER